LSEGRGADIAVLENLFAEWGRGQFWNAAPYAEDVVFVRSGPDGGEYHGLDGLAAAWRDFLGAWHDFRIVGERVVPGGPGVYVLLLRLQGTGHGSGLKVDAEVANLLRMRDGRIVRLEMFWDREAALAAAGAPVDGG
jgi:ketosteroid isomerase-like protein